jgi:PKD repeat protein
MKRIICLSLILPFFILSCQKTPEAYFYSDSSDVEVGQIVKFTNDSHNAVNYEWDFGDGYTSKERNPSHIFSGTGTFEVVLKAVSKSGIDDKATMSIIVRIPTLLEIEVREYYNQYTVASASVILYSTITDWDAQTNKISEGFTDADGIVVFSGLDPFVHYVDVFEAHHDNYTLRKEDVGFIRTSEILPNKINRFIAWVDYVATRKGDGKVERTAVIKKFERKSADKKQPISNGDTEGWQELYNRRTILK